jgi:hypothetical protein
MECYKACEKPNLYKASSRQEKEYARDGKRCGLPWEQAPDAEPGGAASDLVSRAGGRARVGTKHLWRVEPRAGNAGKQPPPRLRPRKSAVPVCRPNQRTGSARPAGPGTSAGSEVAA